MEGFWQTVGLGVLSGCVSLIWSIGEIVGAFKNETGRAMRASGAWMLIGVNFLAAALIFIFLASVIAEANSWLTAVLVGLAWPTVIRNTSIKLAQPLQPDSARDAAAVRFEQAYANVQNLARQMINSTLTRQRMKLVLNATGSPLDRLERFARFTLIASPLGTDQGMPPDQFIDQIMAKQADEEIKKALLAAFILANFGRDTLEDFLKDQPRQRNRPAPPKS